MIPATRVPTTEGKFFNIDNRWQERYIFVLPVKILKEGSEPKPIFILVQADKDTPRAIHEYVFPSLHVHYSDEGIASIEAVRLAVRARLFFPLPYVTSPFAYMGMLPDVRAAREGEHFLVPFLCEQDGLFSHKNAARPAIKVLADSNTRLYSPEVDRFYSETLPLWEDPVDSSWTDICKSISEGRIELDFNCPVPSEFLQMESDIIPQELVHHVLTERRKRNML
ncbi:hypothetical protein HOU08_gp256 [Dickeya phage vB_DsoM_JA29]|uniref:Uncharacterized protein n=1 Tax=Dickeya phage vB_DsoM_JA29 TaxID=2283031 RepID=A0A384ZXL9_9CAUD|nr:hypothetical protein HOU08_gp256 [Dickeya phage vB_DsoM_JA29]AXG66982.1 hypothetical protein JA29_256 [Dickeya phage vB_DsoM_JA29]